VTENHGVGGSIPPLGTNKINNLGPILHFVVRVDNHWDNTRRGFNDRIGPRKGNRDGRSDASGRDERLENRVCSGGRRRRRVGGPLDLSAWIAALFDLRSEGGIGGLKRRLRPRGTASGDAKERE
jgi:hypothetical protein